MKIILCLRRKTCKTYDHFANMLTFQHLVVITVLLLENSGLMTLWLHPHYSVVIKDASIFLHFSLASSLTRHLNSPYMEQFGDAAVPVLF